MVLRVEYVWDTVLTFVTAISLLLTLVAMKQSVRGKFRGLHTIKDNTFGNKYYVKVGHYVMQWGEHKPFGKNFASTDPNNVREIILPVKYIDTHYSVSVCATESSVSSAKNISFASSWGKTPKSFSVSSLRNVGGNFEFSATPVSWKTFGKFK